jgi:hypothetical protein
MALGAPVTIVLACCSLEDMAMMVVELAHPSRTAEAAVLIRRPQAPNQPQLPRKQAREVEAEADRPGNWAEPQSWPRIFPGI